MEGLLAVYLIAGWPSIVHDDLDAEFFELAYIALHLLLLTIKMLAQLTGGPLALAQQLRQLDDACRFRAPLADGLFFRLAW